MNSIIIQLHPPCQPDLSDQDSILVKMYTNFDLDYNPVIYHKYFLDRDIILMLPLFCFL